MVTTLLRAVVGVSFVFAAPVTAATITVGSAKALDKALDRVDAGDTIRLLPGSYGTLDIKNRAFAGAVTFMSADAARPARFDRIRINDSANLRLTNLEVATKVQGQPTSSAIEVFDSRTVTFSGMKVHGVVDGDVTNDIHGLRIGDSTNVSVRKSKFYELRRGIVTTRTTGLTITDNAFTGIRVDGVSNDAASTVTISRNRFSQFRPEGADHPDAIQFFTNGTSMKGITISDNLILGSAAGQLQGVFMTGLATDRRLFDAVTISDNLMWGTMWNGIAGFKAHRVAVTGNRLYSDTSLDVPKTWVRLEDVNQATVKNNYAGHYMYDVGSLTQGGNVTSLLDGLAAAAVRAWDATHFASGLVHAFPPGDSLDDGGLDFALASMDYGAMSRSGRAHAVLSAASAPEPAAWATMIGGFGMIGLTARRRRRQRFARA